MIYDPGLFCVVCAWFNSRLHLPAVWADRQGPLAALPPVLTSQTACPPPPPPPHPRASPPSCCVSSGPRSPSSCCSCSWSAWPAWCPWRRRTTAATTPTTLPAPSIPCCATPMDLRLYEGQFTELPAALPRTPRSRMNVPSLAPPAHYLAPQQETPCCGRTLV